MLPAMRDQTAALLNTARSGKPPASRQAGSIIQPASSLKTPGIDRIQNNILAAAERKLLSWLCARLPPRIMPDHLTAIGFAGTMLTVAGYALSGINGAWLLAAILGYCVNWFGDSLDGSLARYRQIERPAFGYFIDHSLDAVGNFLTMIGFGLSPFVRMDVALLAASAYLLLSAHTFLAARVAGTFRLSYGPMGPTELRVVLIALTIAMWWFGPAGLSVAGYSAFDLFTGTAAMLLLLIFARQTYVLARLLLVADTHDVLMQ
jgi:archaetidylinositol phosphate synthase